MIKMPKKVRFCFQEIRSGRVPQGLAQLESVEGFEMQKQIARAEVAYFSYDWQRGLDLAASFLPHHESFHFMNIFTEHVALAVVATWRLNCWDRSENLFFDLLDIYRSALKGPKKESPFTFQIQETLDQIKDRKETIRKFIDPEFKVRTTGKSLTEIEKQQREVKPKLSAKGKEKERAEYLLFFLHEKGTTADFLSVYERHQDALSFTQHWRAALEYAASGEIRKAERAILAYVADWHPVEYAQVEPVALLTEPVLFPVMTEKFCAEILKTPKQGES